MEIEKQADFLKFSCDVPKDLTVLIGLPKPGYNFNRVSCNGVDIRNLNAVKLKGEDRNYYWLEVQDGSYNFFAN